MSYKTENWKRGDFVRKTREYQPGGVYGPPWEEERLSKEEMLDGSPEAIKKRYSELRDKLKHADKSGG